MRGIERAWNQVDKWMSRRHLPKSLRSRIGHHYQEARLSLTILLESAVPTTLTEILTFFQVSTPRVCQSHCGTAMLSDPQPLIRCQSCHPQHGETLSKLQSGVLAAFTAVHVISQAPCFWLMQAYAHVDTDSI